MCLGVAHAAESTTDVEEPTLILFELDLYAGTLTLSFSETVRFGTLEPELLVLQSTAAGGIEYTLTGGTPPEVTGPSAKLTLTLTDLNAIIALDGLGESQATTYLAMAVDAIQDVNAIGVNSTIGAGVLVATYTPPDETPPVVTGFDLDMDTARLTIRFSEPVNCESFQPGQITLQNTDGASVLESDVTHTLSAASGLESAAISGTTLVVVLSGADMVEMENIDALVSAEGNTFMSIVSGTFSDMSRNQNPLASISGTSAMGVATYIAGTSITSEPVMPPTPLSPTASLPRVLKRPRWCFPSPLPRPFVLYRYM